MQVCGEGILVNRLNSLLRCLERVGLALALWRVELKRSVIAITTQWCILHGLLMLR